MGTIKMTGIIISENNLGDYDKMLTMLTPGLGKISCVAKGARRQKSALLAGTQFLCFGEYLMLIHVKQLKCFTNYVQTWIS